MVQVAGSGSAADPGRPVLGPPANVEVDIEQLRDFCGGSLQRMRDDVQQVVRDFDGLPASRYLFSEADPGLALADQHINARAIYSATLAGLATDLERLQTDLRAQLDAYQRADDDAAEALQRLGQNLTAGPLASDLAREDAMRARADVIADPAPPAPPSPTPAAPTPTTIRAADPAPAPASAPAPAPPPAPSAPAADPGAEGF